MTTATNEEVTISATAAEVAGSPEISASSEVLGIESGRAQDEGNVMEESTKESSGDVFPVAKIPDEKENQKNEKEKATAALIHGVTKKLQRTYVHSQHVLAAQWNADHLQLYLLTFQDDSAIPSTSDPTNRQLIDLDKLFHLAHTDGHGTHHHHQSGNHHSSSQPARELSVEGGNHSPTATALASKSNSGSGVGAGNHTGSPQAISKTSSQDKIAVTANGHPSRKILILGGPQVGKSTLLEHIALQWSQESLFHRDFRAVFHIRLRLFFTNWKDNFTEEEILKKPLHCYLWFCVRQEPGYHELGFDEQLTKEEVFAYLSLPNSIDETLLLVHRFDQVDQYLQSCPEHSVDYEIFESIFDYTHVIFTAREGFTYSPTMKKFDRFVEGKIVMEPPKGSGDGVPVTGTGSSEHGPTGGRDLGLTVNLASASSDTAQPLHHHHHHGGHHKKSPSNDHDPAQIAASPSAGQRTTSKSPKVGPLSFLAALSASHDQHDEKDKEQHHHNRKASINSPRAAGSSSSGAGGGSPAAANGGGLTAAISHAQKRVYPETNYQAHLTQNEEAKYAYMAQNMIMNVTVIMECDKLGFTSSEKLDDLQNKLSQCLQQHSYLFDQYPHKQVIDSFTSQLHRIQVMFVVKEPYRAIEINEILVNNIEFWKRYGKIVSNDLAGIEEEIEDFTTQRENTTRSSCSLS